MEKWALKGEQRSISAVPSFGATSIEQLLCAFDQPTLKNRICRTEIMALETSVTWPALHAMPRSRLLRHCTSSHLSCAVCSRSYSSLGIQLSHT